MTKEELFRMALELTLPTIIERAPCGHDRDATGPTRFVGEYVRELWLALPDGTEAINAAPPE